MKKKEIQVVVDEKELTPHEKDEALRMKLMVEKAQREQNEK